MSKNECGMIKDLLPLYADEVCSDESREIVAKHIEKCSECRSELEKMGRNIKVSFDNDIEVVKRVKRRIRIEKIVLSLVAILTASIVGFTLFMHLCLLVPMDSEKYDIAENISAEVDEEGYLWIETTGKAQNYTYIVPKLMDRNGYFPTDENYDETDDNKTFCVEFMKRRIDIIAERSCMYSAYGEFDRSVRRRKMFNVNDRQQYDKVVYYDSKNEKEYVIWEREENE